VFVIVDCWVCFQVLHYLPPSLVHRKTQGFHKTAVKVGDFFVFTFQNTQTAVFPEDCY
jgi:hypothetical protein